MRYDTRPRTRPPRASWWGSSRASSRRSWRTTSPPPSSPLLVRSALAPRSCWAPVDLDRSGEGQTACGREVLRHARDLDVHIIAVGSDRPDHVHLRTSTPDDLLAASDGRDRGGGGALAAVDRCDDADPIERVAFHDLPRLLVAILALTTWAGAAVGVLSALAASGLENFYFVKPLHTLEVARPDDLVALVAFFWSSRCVECGGHPIRSALARGRSRAGRSGDSRRGCSELRVVARRFAPAARFASKRPSPPPAWRSSLDTRGSGGSTS